MIVLPPLPLPTVSDIFASSDSLYFSHSWFSLVIEIALTAFNAARSEANFAILSKLKAENPTDEDVSQKFKRPSCVIHACDWTSFIGIKNQSISVAVCVSQLYAALISEIDTFIYHAITEQEKEIFDEAYSLLYKIVRGQSISSLNFKR